ncbi:MAG: hypothetical protein WCC01_10675 [Acidimicrobiia bacterium]
MPAPKQFKPGPTTSREYTTGFSSSRIKGRHAVVPPPPKPSMVPAEDVEVDVEEVTVVMRGPSKYEQRSMGAYVDPSVSIDLDALDAIGEPVEAVEPVRSPRIVFGEWRSESDLDGTHYHRKDSRLI